ncbi:MAG: Holliday junction resolvase RuvX [Porticoccaceae bacterium]
MSATPEAHVTLLCFDFGIRQIGVAYGQTFSGTAQPVAVLRARDGQPQWEQVTRLVAEWQPQRLLVGLPLNMDGTESDFCTRVRRFAGRLHARTGKPVTLMDERLSTAEAKRDSGSGRDYRRHPVDGLAAALILRTWLSEPAAGRDL